MAELPTVLEVEGPSSTMILYSEITAERICEQYARGMSLHKISKLAEMPNYNTLLKWVRHHPEFRVMFEHAKAARAIHLENMAQETAEEVYENAGEKDLVPAGRLKVDTYFKVAEVNDPTKYGKKITHEGNAERPIVFQVNTGFPELNEHQRAPELTADGVIARAKPVEAEIAHGGGIAPEDPDSGSAQPVHSGGGVCATGEDAPEGSHQRDPGTGSEAGAQLCGDELPAPGTHDSDDAGRKF